MTSEGYPTDNAGATASLGMSYDTMGRLYTLTDQLASVNIIASASYGPANELTGLTAGSYSGNWGSESRGYNVMKQLTSLSSNGVSLTYSYSSTQNNGKITSQSDTVSGETVTYAYDSLNRLYTAAATSGGSWSQTYNYDGFGNLTSITGNAAASYSYNSATNQGSCSDANGNSNEVSCLGVGYGYTYDIENRIVQTGTVDGPYFYSYAPGNKRVWRGNGGTTDEITFWSPSGQKLGTYAITETAQTFSGGVYSGPYFYATQTGTNYYFGGKLIKNASGWVYSDRLGSIGKFYPYGQERPSATTNGTEKFTGYFRDAETGLDYASQRYYGPGTGRFLTPDPYKASGGPADPGSWNRYAYTRGDPVNRFDREGLEDDDDDGQSGCDDCDLPFPMASGFVSLTPYGNAVKKLRTAVSVLENRMTVSPNCQKDLDKLSKGSGEDITLAAIQGALSNTNFMNGIGSNLPVSTLGGPGAEQFGITQQNIADQKYGAGATIGPLFKNNPGTSAETVLLGTTIFINPGLIGNSLTSNEGLLMHEALHELGFIDTDIQGWLGITVDAYNTKNISNQLTKDCTSGKGNN